MTPLSLAAQVHSLPPILHKLIRITLPSYSKGSRGLSVLLRVPGICAGTSISLSSWLRQWASRYAIRAGRNLPAKEFRYLRTVIVTAAVYRGFDSVLAHVLLTFRHRAGVSPYTSSYDLAETCVFAKQSLPPGHCDPLPLRRASRITVWGHTFSRSYGANLQSSLDSVLSSALGYSPHPPVLVCGTVRFFAPRAAFLGSMGSLTSLCPKTQLVVTSRP